MGVSIMEKKLFKLVFAVVLFLFMGLRCSWGVRLNLFLDINGPKKIWIIISKIEIVTDKGTLSLALNSKYITPTRFGQLFLGRIDTDGAEKLSSIVIYVEGVGMDNARYNLCNKRLEIPLGYKLRGDSFSSFLIWNTNEGWGKLCYKPSFSFKVQGKPVNKEVLLALCEDTHELFFIRTDLNRVEASISVGKRPEDLCVGYGKDEVYVISELDRMLHVLNISYFKEMDSYTLPFVSMPNRVVRMDRERVVITDGSTGYVIVLNTGTGEILKSVRIGFGISDVEASEEKQIVAISVPKEQKVYLFDYNLERIGNIRLAGVPSSLWINNDYIYVANKTHGTVEIYNIKTLRKQASVYSGSLPKDIIDTGVKVYVSNSGENSLSVFDKNQYVILKKINLISAPDRMTFCSLKSLLYVILKGKGKIAVVDVIRDKILGSINIGCEISSILVNKGS